MDIITPGSWGDYRWYEIIYLNTFMCISSYSYMKGVNVSIHLNFFLQQLLITSPIYFLWHSFLWPKHNFKVFHLIQVLVYKFPPSTRIIFSTVFSFPRCDGPFIHIGKHCTDVSIEPSLMPTRAIWFYLFMLYEISFEVTRWITHICSSNMDGNAINNSIFYSCIIYYFCIS